MKPASTPRETLVAGVVQFLERASGGSIDDARLEPVGNEELVIHVASQRFILRRAVGVGLLAPASGPQPVAKDIELARERLQRDRRRRL